jgi:hypothetical protein
MIKIKRHDCMIGVVLRRQIAAKWYCIITKTNRYYQIKSHIRHIATV